MPAAHPYLIADKLIRIKRKTMKTCSAQRPNVLLVLTDQQRRDSLGCYGNPIGRTPNLDRLASRGVRFDRNYVANPICMPNRLSIFTGRNIRNHGLWTNGLLVGECRTLPGWFAEHGYRTASIGKIHFTPYGGRAGNLESAEYWKSAEANPDWYGPYWGFQHVELTIGHTAQLAHYGQWFRTYGGTAEMMKPHPVVAGGDSYRRRLPEELHDSAFVAERSIAFLRECRHADQPFFLVASFPDPHHPFDPPETVAAQYDPAAVPLPVGGREDLAARPPHYLQHFRGEWSRHGLVAPAHPDGYSEVATRERIAHTCAMVELIDRNVGRILEHLEQSGLADNTIVVFTSDHGELLGDHGLWYKGPFYYEGLLNTPLIVAGPGLLSGVVSDALFSDLDIAPTLCDLAAIPPLPGMDGVSQKTHLDDPRRRVRDHCLIEYRNGYGAADVSSKCIVADDMKYVRYQDGVEELTDLGEDPQEMFNLAASSANAGGTVAQMRTRLLDAILATECKTPEQLSHA